MLECSTISKPAPYYPLQVAVSSPVQLASGDLLLIKTVLSPIGNRKDPYGKSLGETEQLTSLSPKG